MKDRRIASGNVREMEEQWIRQVQSRGWADATEEQVSMVDNLFETDAAWQLDTLEEFIPFLRTAPSDLQHTLLEDAVLQRVLPSGQSFDGGYTGLTRLLLHPGLGRVALVEGEYALTGERIHIHCKELHPSFNGLPLVYGVFQAPSGNAQTTFVWFTDRKEFQLYIGAAILKTNPFYKSITQELMPVLK